jgi:outer membrane cobalamin receptor
MLSGRKATIMVLKETNYYVFVCCWLCLQFIGSFGYVLGQELPPVNLKSVEILEQRISPFAIGASTTKLDSAILKLEAPPNLAELISYYTSSAVKSYGNGMLSTISFRGTGPSHTAVLWHGINISYPMLGQSDLSMLSLALSDQVTLQHGTGGALYGSGALGGTISLSDIDPSMGTNLSISQWFGSFGTIKNSIRTSYANDRFSIKVATLWDQSSNQFKFKNTTKAGSPKEIQQGAGYKTYGTSIDMRAAIGERGKLSLSGQFFNANRDLQPSMNVNTTADNQSDENIRIRTKYESHGPNISWNVNYAYLYDVIGFNGDKTFAHQQVLRVEGEKNIFSWLDFNLAADYNFIQINSPFYSSDKTKEQRANVWASFLINPIERLLLSVNLRQSFNQDYKIPFTPSVGVEYTLFTGDHVLVIKTLVARGYRVPTLNERYWVPGGNPNLAPENSYSAEIGLAGLIKNQWTISYEITGYRMLVDNWILWRPQGNIWSPENIKQVDIYGLEASGSVTHSFGAANIKLLGNYAFTKSINRTGLDQFDRSVNKQLVYTPIHNATISAITQLQNWSAVVNAAFTGQRFVTADNEDSLPEYLLLNIRVGKSFRKGNYLFSAHANVNNILNTQYQSVENKAMPGTNFLLGLTISYSKL